MRLILFSILFTGVANVDIAQKISIGVNGGISFSSTIKNLDDRTAIISGEQQSAFSPFGSLKGTLLLGNWQFGLSVNYTTANYKADTWPDPSYIPYPNGYWIEGEPNYITLRHASMVPLRPFVNRQVRVGKIHLYGGVAASYIIMPHGEGRPWFGYGGGAQIGATYPISKHISMNIEATGDKMWFRQGPECLLTMYNTTASLGLTYRLK